MFTTRLNDFILFILVFLSLSFAEKDRFKPHPPPKPSAIPGQYDDRHLYSSG